MYFDNRIVPLTLDKKAVGFKNSTKGVKILQINIENIAKQERKEYFKEWRLKNKEKIQKYNFNYWERRALKHEQKKTLKE